MKIRVCINDDVLFDGDPGDWKAIPPNFIRDIKGGDPQPWMKAILIAMTDAVMQSKSMSIECWHRSNRWQLKVEEL